MTTAEIIGLVTGYLAIGIIVAFFFWKDESEMEDWLYIDGITTFIMAAIVLIWPLFLWETAKRER